MKLKETSKLQTAFTKN